MLTFKQYILVEAKIDDYKAQETNISTSHDPDAKFKKPADIIDHFHKHAPGGNIQHTRWMIDRYKKGEMKQEDAPDMKETLSNFEKYKPNLPKKRVEQYKSIADLKTAIHPFKEKDEQVKNVNHKKISEGSTVVHNSPNITAYHVHSTEAAQELGKSPKGEKLGWCTSHPDPDKNMFKHYDKDSGKNFHILHMHKEEFPYRRIGGVGVDGQFQDENNEKIEGDKYKELLHRNPELHKIKAVADSEHHGLERLKDPNLSKEELDKLVTHPKESVRMQVAKRPDLNKDHLNKLAGDSSSTVKYLVAKHPNTTKEHFDKLVKDPDQDVKDSVAEHSPHKEHQDELIKHDNLSTKYALSKNKNLSKENSGKLANDDNSNIKSNIAERSPHKEVLDKLINDSNSGVKGSIAKNPNARKEHFDKLINDSNPSVKNAVARYSPHKEHLDKLISDDEEDPINAHIANNPNAKKEHLDKLVKNKYDMIRSAIVKHPNADKNHLTHLANDPNDNIRDHAKKELEKRFG